MHHFISTLVMSSIVSTLQAAPSGHPLDVANTAFRAKDWATASAGYEVLIQSNPNNGVFWRRYGYAQRQLGNCASAIKAFEKATLLGEHIAENQFQKARCLAKLDQPSKAIQALEMGFANGLDHVSRIQSESDFEVLSKSPGFQRLAQTGDNSDLDRTSGWRSDLDYLVDQLNLRHVDLFHSIPESDFRIAIGKLKDDIPNLTDRQVAGELMRIAASVGDGHTVIYPPLEGLASFRLVPIVPYLFSDGLFFLSASPENKTLVGARVVSANGVSVDQIVKNVGEFLPRDNAMTLRWLTPIALQFFDTWGFATDPKAEAIRLQLQTPDGKPLKTVLHPNGEPRNVMSPSAPSGWPSMLAGDTPLWLKHTDKTFWYQVMPNGGIYFQLNAIRDDENQTLSEFVDELFSVIDKKKITTLIIDLRQNNGGNNTLNQSLVHALIRNDEVNQHGRLFAIVGRRTFSAAMNLASDLETHTNVMFVGEPTGSKPNFYGEDSIYRLPFSGLVGSVSTRRWQGGFNSSDQRIWIAPDLAAPMSSEDYRNGRDPALETILDYLH